LPAPTPSNEPLLIAAVSGRSLAAAARRAGYRPLVADLFCDLDTVDLAEKTVRVSGALEGGLAAEGLAEALQGLSDGETPAALICGSGFEEHPELVDELAQQFPVAGCSGDAIRRIKHPIFLADECARIGIPFPEIELGLPSEPKGWLAKLTGGAGGLHIFPAAQAEQTHGIYYQRAVQGSSVSALFMADATGARMVGFSHQWTCPTPKYPYRFCGAVRLESFPDEDAAMIAEWLSALSRSAGLIGMCSADFIKSGQTYHLLEINPRPGATLDIFDHEDAPLLAAHLAASRGEEAPLPVHENSMASMVVYAFEDIETFPEIDWPAWLADRQPAGTHIRRDEPICTIFAEGKTAYEAQELLFQREGHLREIVSGSR